MNYATRVVLIGLVAGAVIAIALVVSTSLSVVVAGILGLGLSTFAFYGYDKLQAKRDRRRLPNHSLRALAVLGGAAGGLAAMLIFRHKINYKTYWIAQALGGLVIVAAIWLL